MQQSSAMPHAVLLAAYQAWVEDRRPPRGDTAAAVLRESAAVGVAACLAGSGWPLVLFVAELASKSTATTAMAADWFCAAAASSELVRESEMYVGLAEAFEEKGASLAAALAHDGGSALQLVERILAASVLADSVLTDDGARGGDAPTP